MVVESIESLCQRARQAIAQGKIEQARHLYLQALAARPDAPDVHYGLATVCFLLNDLEKAAYHFKEVTRLDPLRPGAHINLGAVYNRLEKYSEAIPPLRRGIQLDPHRAEGYYNLGLVYRNSSQPQLAIQAYLEATRINPRMVDAHYNLANLYLELGRLGQAITHYKRVLEMRPNWEKALDGLAQAEALQAATGAPAAPAPGAPKSGTRLATKEAKPKEAPQPAAATAEVADPERIVDPYLHGAILTNLHQATIDSETNGKEFLRILEAEIETALKELSACLLDTTGTASLNACIQKFETAMQNMRKSQAELQSCMERVRTVGDKLLKA